MIRKIVHIDKEKCNGCGICAEACHEGAIRIIGGKAVLISDDYCDGFGDCLPGCPTGAITIEEREAAAYDAQAVKARQQAAHTGCPGAMAKMLHREATSASVQERPSQLGQWPAQIKLMPISAPYYQGAKLLIAEDCTAFAYASIHERFMQDHITVIGCPKLDGVDYTEKLTRIIAENDIREVTVIRMEVPCCGGLENAAKGALLASGKTLPWKVVIVSVDGRLLER